MRSFLAGMVAVVMSFGMATTATAADLASVTSPDGRIAVSVAIDGDGRINYTVAKSGKPIIASSKLGFILADAYALVRGFTFIDAEATRADSTWEQPWGERRFVRDHHNELLVRFRQPGDGDRRLHVRFRVFDDGIGFRYELPAQPNLKTVRIADEVTEFQVAQPGTAWWIPGGEWNRYEQVYQETAIDAVSTAHTPITMKLADGTHLAFHEAAIVDYAAMSLKRADGQLFRSTLSPSGAGPRVVRETPFATPWRSLRIADGPRGLVESDLELNLNEPNKLGDVSWFKPFKYIGIWWGMITGKWSWASGDTHGATTARAKQYIDFAAKHGFRGVLVEGWNKGWDGNWFGHGDKYSFTEAYADFDLKAVTDYARAKGVRIIGHHETGGNIAVYEPQLDDAFKLYARAGVDTVKTGYVADAGGIIAPGEKPAETRMEWHDGQRMAVHHLDVVKAAARHKIAVNPHEPIKDSGLRRTYPNWVAREGARGMEYNAWGQYANGPDHEPTLVYTRMLSGPMDFTPGVLSLKGSGEFRLASTLAKQLALYLVIYSPIQMAADYPEELAKYPRELDFISKVPADWSDSRLIAGEVGDFAVFARQDRNSSDWYVGGVTDADARNISVAFDFLDDGKAYTASIYRDGDAADYRTERRHDIVHEKTTVKKGDRLAVRMAPGGGFAIRLTPRR